MGRTHVFRYPRDTPVYKLYKNMHDRYRRRIEKMRTLHVLEAEAEMAEMNAIISCLTHVGLAKGIRVTCGQ